MSAVASHARGSLAVSLSHHQKEVWIKGIDTKNHIDGLLIRGDLQHGKVAEKCTRTVWVRPRAARRSTNVCWALQTWRTCQWY